MRMKANEANSPAREIIELLTERQCRFSVLRPVPLRQERVKDVDLLAPADELPRLLALLAEHFGGRDITWARPVARHTFWIQARETLLDIRTSLSFLPYKNLTLPLPLPLHPGCDPRDAWLMPRLPQDILFTLWTFHLILDKRTLRRSESFHLYRALFARSGPDLITSGYFRDTGMMICGGKRLAAIQALLDQARRRGWDEATCERLSAQGRKILISRPVLLLTHAILACRWILRHRISHGQTFSPITSFPRHPG